MGVPSPKGKLWQESVVYRLAPNQVPLGRIIYGKTSDGLNKNQKTAPFQVNPRENWVIVENAHPAVKTPQEHAEIVKLLEQRRIQTKQTRHGTYAYSGLVFCGKCGSAMQFQPEENGSILVKKCQKVDPYGNRCGNPGADLEHVDQAVIESLRDYDEEIRSKPIQTTASPDMTPQMVLRLRETELNNVWEFLDEKLDKKNRLLKQIIERIEYTRNGYRINVRIKFH